MKKRQRKTGVRRKPVLVQPKVRDVRVGFTGMVGVIEIRGYADELGWREEYRRLPDR